MRERILMNSDPDNTRWRVRVEDDDDEELITLSEETLTSSSPTARIERVHNTISLTYEEARRLHRALGELLEDGAETVAAPPDIAGPPLYRCACCGCPESDHAPDGDKRACAQCLCRRYERSRRWRDVYAGGVETITERGIDTAGAHPAVEEDKSDGV
jgi:hypothetical protein